MKKYILMVIGVAFVLAGCNNTEETLTPSYADFNWRDIKDSSDPIDHQRYLLYQQYGIAVFVNDTVWTENRGTDGNGNPIIYNKVIDLNYTLNRGVNMQLATAAPTGKSGDYVKGWYISRLKTDAEKLAALDFVDQYVLPRFGKNTRIPAIILADTLLEIRLQDRKGSVDAFCSSEILAIGTSWLKAETPLTEAENQTKANNIIKYSAYGYLMANMNMLKNFFEPSLALYEISVSPYSPTTPSKRQEEYGFLTRHPTSLPVINETTPPSTWQYKTTTKYYDVQDFCYALFDYTAADFAQKYKAYPKVMAKYNAMKDVLVEAGFTFN